MFIVAMVLKKRRSILFYLSLAVLAYFIFGHVSWAAEKAILPKLSSGFATSGSDVFQVVAALIAVLVIFMLSALVVKRTGFMRIHNSDSLKVLAQLSLNNKDRILLIEAGDTQLLVGASQNTINTLHVFNDKIIERSNSASSSRSFVSQLNHYIRQRNKQ